MAEQQYQLQELSTLDVSDKERPDYWVEHVRINQGRFAMDFGELRGFVGSTRTQRCADYQLVEFSSNLINYRRTARHVRTDDDRSARLLIPLNGRIALTQHDETVQLGPGDIGMISLARPMSLAHADGVRAWILTIPEGTIPATVTDDSSLLALDPQRPMLGTVVAMTRALAQHRERMTARDFVQINSNLVDLLAKALDDRQAPHLSGLAAIAQAARTYVEQHSDDPTVRPNSIAEHLGCSLRQLHKALTTMATTPAQLLRNTRLERARRRLQDPFNPNSVDQVAFNSGFGSLSAFREAFRKRYGVNPGQLRNNRIR